MTRYGYDDADRLTSVGGPTSASYAYDGDGYRVRKTVGAATTTYAWDRLGTGGLGTVISDGTHEYVHGPAGLQRQVVTATAQARYAYGDGLGSVLESPPVPREGALHGEERGPPRRLDREWEGERSPECAR